MSVTLADYNNRWDAFGGYGYARFNTTIGHASKGNLMGFKAQVTGWITPVVGLTASTGNYYGNVGVPANAFNITNPAISEHLFLFGPTFRLLRDPKYTVDYHFLLGGTYGIFDTSFKSAGVEPNVLNLPNNQLAFALATGVSFDYNIKPNWSARAIIDFEPTRYGLAFQKDVAASIGVVYKWGAIKK
ncbi:hypothetical protein ACPOL_0168 [Acidisarcina polymorpha]|uniref:Outer membrane protein beta-barrel domain-containing protein n=1 Tax=Acidisarcina polymorpha TaxID=2211140 RepID=A0A2Z5FS41_9BACT|nr:hypothetical protein ACPOL_0168 [Acidisarcina polymorpha]